YFINGKSSARGKSGVDVLLLVLPFCVCIAMPPPLFRLSSPPTLDTKSAWLVPCIGDCSPHKTNSISEVSSPFTYIASSGFCSTISRHSYSYLVWERGDCIVLMEPRFATGRQSDQRLLDQA